VFGMKTFGGRSSYALAAVVLLIGAGAVAEAASIVGPALYVCSGTAAKPGVLKGNVVGDLDVSGVCYVNAGPATVHGILTVDAKSVLVASFGHNDRTHRGSSPLTVTGDVVVDKGATAFLGCLESSSPCFDDNQQHPTLNGPVTIKGSIKVTGALGVIVHDGKIGGSVTEAGGGGGFNCNPQGPFKAQQSPAFSDYEDNSIAGSITIKNMTGCYLGVLRDKVIHNMTLTGNKFADADAIEVGTNNIKGNLSCSGNSMVWDTTEINMNATFPRQPKLNTVHGKRSGQCVKESRRTATGPLGPSPF
jgi:hypothetical protein